MDGTDVVDLTDPTPFSIADGAYAVTFRFAETGAGRFGPGESWGFHVDYDTRDGTNVRPPRGRDTRPIDGDMAHGVISVTFDHGDTLSYVYDPDQIKLVGGRVAFPAFRLVDPPPTEVAEPSGGALLAASLVLLGLRRRR